MLFNSFFYIFIFLPSILLIYFFISTHVNFTSAKLILTIASFFFYAWWNPIYLPLLLVSIFINYILFHLLKRNFDHVLRTSYLIGGILFNLMLLAYFKYTNFFVNNINVFLKAPITYKEVILPLGISFFTFTQIAFLVDAYKNSAKQVNILDYCLFVSFFPHLLAGPIIHHTQIMPQFADKKNAIMNYKNIYFGLALFIIGLAKKVIVADTFAFFANSGFTNSDHLTLMSAWTTSLSYTFQIYFDFSGYTDMAIGASKLFNINLPINFNSPYQSLNIREFWHRWHITLSHFLRDYLYIPLGGNRVSEIKVYRNLILTFILGGFWHGAGWTFILWGFFHGLALTIVRLFRKLKINLPKPLAWFITFNFINITWIFFRADSIEQAFKILCSMFDITQIEMASFPITIFLFLFGFIVILRMPNSGKLIASSVLAKQTYLPWISFLMVLSVISMEITNSHEFIYFKF